MTNDELDRLCRGSFVAHVEYHPVLSSTNDRARRLASELHTPMPALVVAEQQTAGRGRGSNRWWTGPGSLALSLLVDPAGRGIERRWFSVLPLAAALAIVESSAAAVAGARFGLHWPNDVFAADRKVAGVLVEGLADGRHIVGIGWNVNNTLDEAPAELSRTVGTLRDLAGRLLDRTALAIDLLSRLNGLLDGLAREPHSLGRRANRACLQHGRTLTLEAGSRRTTGVCAGIADDGALLLDTPAGRQAHYSGVLIRTTHRS